MRGTALRDNVACTAFALTTLRGHAQLQLHFVERQSCTRVTRNFAIGHSAAHTNDHGEDGFGWLIEESHYKYEFVAFAIMR